MRDIFGDRDENIKYLTQRYNVIFTVNTGELNIIGEEKDCNALTKIFPLLEKMAERGEKIKLSSIRFVAEIVENGEEDKFEELTSIATVNYKGRPIKAKTFGQARYLKSMEKNSIVFCIGPAGSGKTYLAVARAVQAFKNKEVERIVLTRPAVEAGEKLGFLPGDLGAKVDPYLRPLYDALQEMFGLDVYARLIEKGAIEIAPLAYMRGRTLSNAFIILDEAQNTTKEQMKMFLTRMGESSKIVVTGDITQIDLPYGKKSGLIEATELLNGVEDISIISLKSKDVVRNELVMRIVEAYEHADILKKAFVKEECEEIKCVLDEKNNF